MGINSWDKPWLNPKFLAGSTVLFLVISFGLFGSLFWNTDLAFVGRAPLDLPPAWAEGGSMEHPLGTESNGRDMLAQLILAVPSSLLVGLIASSLGLIVGIILGSQPGYLGGMVDNIIRLLSDSVVTIPALAVLIVITSYISMETTTPMAFMLALFAWPRPTRLIRAQILSLKERGYIKIAKLSGVSSSHIMFKEMMPNMLPWLAASFTGGVSGAILGATGLEALGLGPTRVPSLGMIISHSTTSSALVRGMYWWWFPSIIILVLIFFSLFLVTMGLDEIANPRLRRFRK